MAAAATSEPVLLARLERGVGLRVAAGHFASLLEREPANRPQGARAFLKALDEARSNYARSAAKQQEDEAKLAKISLERMLAVS